jgi:hypothetical protein
MAKLYRQVVLKEQPGDQLVGIKGIAPAPAPAKEAEEEVGSFGD